MSRTADRPNTAAETRTPKRLEPASRVLDECRHRVALLQPTAIPVDRGADVAVGGEPHVVEHDLVEPATRSRFSDIDVVVPDPPVVRVRPAEARAVLPDGAVAAQDRELRTPVREDRVLEDDDAADEVQPATVNELRRVFRGVEVPRCSDLPGECRRTVGEPDLPVLVLDVQLDRRQPVSLEVDVLLELARKRGKRHGHVDASNLDGKRSRARRRYGSRLLECVHCSGRGRLGIGTEELGSEPDRRDRHQQDADQGAALSTLPAPCRCPPMTKALVRLDWWEKHRHRRGDLTAVLPPTNRVPRSQVTTCHKVGGAVRAGRGS